MLLWHWNISAMPSPCQKINVINELDLLRIANSLMK